MSEHEESGRAVDDESAIIERGDDPGAFSPPGDDTPVDDEEDGP